MSTDPGTVSLTLYCAFIAIAIIALFILFRFLKRGTLEPDKLDKLIDFFKTVVYTTALGTVAFIVTNLFKEREQQMKEMEYFGKYVDVVQGADNSSARLELTRYLATVSPKGNIKDAWTDYYDTLVRINRENAYIMARKLDSTGKKEKVDSIVESLLSVQSIAASNRPLSSASLLNEWYLVVGTDNSLSAAKDELKKAIIMNPSATIYKRDKYYHTVIPGFSTNESAQMQIATVKNVMGRQPIIVNKNTWCPDPILTDSCSICR